MAEIVHLSAADVAMVLSWDRTVRHKLGNKRSYTGQEDKDRYIVGYVGEVALALLMDRMGLAYLHVVNITGRSERTEFEVRHWDTGATAALELKTRGKASYDLMLVSKLQHDHSAPFVIGCRIEKLSDQGAEVSVMGWLARAEVEALPVKEFKPGHPSWYHPYAKVHPIDELLEQFASGKGERRVIGEVIEAAPEPAPPRAGRGLGHPPTPPEVRFPGDRYDMTLEQWKAATSPAPPIKPDKGAPVSGMVLWFQHEIALAKASHGHAWPEHKRFAVDYLREEMAVWVGAEAAAEVVEKAASHARR